MDTPQDVPPSFECDTFTMPLDSDGEDTLDVWLDAATAALGGDGELRREAREALRADASGGEWEDAGAAAERVAAAYTPRLRRRLFARRLIAWVLIPAALLAALLLGVDFVCSVQGVGGITDTVYRGERLTPHVFPWTSAADRQSIATYTFLTEGDTTRPTIAAQQRAIWEAHPENVTYYQNYALFLITETWTQPESIKHFEDEMRRGQQLDPGNALYGYLLAIVLAQASTTEVALPRPDPATGYPWAITVQDRPMFDRAMAEYLAASRLPHLVLPHAVMLRDIIASLPPGNRESDLLQRASVLSDVYYPEYGRLRRLARGVTCYTQLLISEGKHDDALTFARAWRRCSRHLTESSDSSYIGMAVATALTKLCADNAVKTFNALGLHDEAKTTRTYADRVLKPAIDFRARIQTGRNVPLSQDPVGRHAGMLAGVLLPLFGTDMVTTSELLTDLRVEQTYTEEIAGILLAFLLLLLLVRTWLLHLGTRIETGRTWKRPLFILLTPRQWLISLGGGFLAPVFFYAVATRFLGSWLGRDEGGKALLYFTAPEATTVAVVCLILTGALASAAIRRRCMALGVAMPEPRRDLLGRMWGVLGCLLWLAIVCLPILVNQVRAHEPHFPFDITTHDLRMIEYLVYLLLVVLLLLPGIIRRLEARPGAFAAYRGTLARSLLPVYAAALLLTCAVIYPSLVAVEEHWVSRDIMIAPRGQANPAMTIAESRVTERLRSETLRAFDEKE